MEKVKRMILIDDDEVTCFLNKCILEELEVADYIKCLYNGEQAIQFIKENYVGDTTKQTKPDLFFLDLNMPIMDGFEFLEEFEKLDFINKGRLKIIILSSSENQQDAEKISLHNDLVLQYLIKPLQKENVKEIMETI